MFCNIARSGYGTAEHLKDVGIWLLVFISSSQVTWPGHRAEQEGQSPNCKLEGDAEKKGGGRGVA